MMDPVNLEIISNALSSIAEEMGEVLAARALSTGISQKRNYSTAIFTTGGFLAAVGDHVPVHLGPLHLLAQAVLKIHPLHSLSQGDSIITNDPYLRGFQPPWICMVSPVYHNHVPLAVVASIAHHSDAGGLVPGGMPTSSWEIYHEGIRIPPVKIVKKGQLDNNLALLISSNIRTPFEFTSDIKAQLSAAKFAGKRLNDLVVRYGTDKIKRYMTGIIDRTETRTRELLNILPAGIYTFEDFIEVDSQPGFTVNIRLTVSKDDDNLTFDFTGTHPQVEYPVNASRELTLSGVYYAVRSALCPEIPINDGFFRPIRAITPEGSLLNPGFPAPVALAGVNTAQRVTDTVFGCLASAIPERIEAAGTGSACSFTAGGIPSSGEEYYSLAETHGGGQGAKVSGDGMDGVGAGISNLMGTPVEIIERDFPLIINSSRLITDSGGPGKFRGGLGIQT
ncbi:MAG: hydantoinase B/oxoprolinase family protein, partial [Bacillota bacterium]